MELVIYLFLILREKKSCFYSSFIFLINVIACFLYDKLMYGLLFFLLFTTSIFYYTYNDITTYFLDQLSIGLVVIYGLFIFISKKKRRNYILIILYSFLTTIYLYYYGYITNSYCYGYYNNEYHSLLHIISCIGHLAILFM